MKSIVLILALVSSVAAHGILACPKPRAGFMGTTPGLKLTPRPPSAAKLQDCEGTQPGNITATYTAGSTIKVTWDNTIDHPSSPGVRIAFAPAPGAAFQVLSAFGNDIGPEGCNSLTVTLPNTVSKNAILQWIWDSESDGGYYLGCADIATVASGAPADTCVCVAGASSNPGAGGSGSTPGKNAGEKIVAAFLLIATLVALLM
eukprot:TRINITY_DN21391_c0_g1_i1.p1 TRINITY_DN21391_c0_g1~~TRINITY_DN21391_c0_g1_i1.p1  ORF type:complete len:214 (+),score=52.57 TRINITY_DN21391_c0_g1_i1:34-642(+)